jgi:chemotaxis signal transduction protein
MHTPAREQTVIILLEAAGQHFGLPIAVVRDALQVSRAGRSGSWRVRGAVPSSSCDGRMIDVGGQLAPLIDVCASLGAPRGRSCHGRTRSVVVVQCGERWLGLLVDAVGEVVEVPLRAIVPRSGPLASHLAIRQAVLLADRKIGLLDADHLAPTAEQLTVA